MSKELKCSFCGRAFINAGALALHEKRWRKSNPNIEHLKNISQLPQAPNPGVWECAGCHKIFRIKVDLESHLADNPTHKVFKRRKTTQWVCKVCGLHFRVRRDLSAHMNELNHKLYGGSCNHQHSQYTCKYCSKSWVTTKDGATKHENYCKLNPNRVMLEGKPHSEEMKRHLSEKRKEYLAAHLEDHVWKRHSKFESIPCNTLKEYLRSKGYSFIEEASIIPNRHFAVDICFPDKMIVVEVNGNQHYDMSTMELTAYYKERHDLIESFGWTVIEVPYNKAYSDEFRDSLCNLLDGANVDISTFDYKHECMNIHEKASAKRKQYNDKLEAASKNGTLNKNGKLSGNKVSTDELNRRKELILNSGVDLTKIGWVKRVTELTGLSQRVIYKTVNQFDDLKSKVFRRGC